LADAAAPPGGKMVLMAARPSCVTALVLALSFAAAAAAQDRPSPDQPRQDDGRRTIRSFPVNLGRAAVGVFSRDNLVPALVGGAATGAALAADDAVRDAVSDPNSGFDRTVGTWSGAGSAALTAGLFVAGRFSHGPVFRAMTYDMADAVVVTLGYTSALKVAVGRERPNGADDRSFPSGHAANAFALAAVADRHYGWRVGVPAYGLAAVVAASRVRVDAHYLSDVVAGSAIGFLVGRTVVRLNSRPPAVAGGSPRRAVAISPVIGRRSRAVVAVVVFR
jgi:membrane-associated phospholipid phosphatase